MITLNGEQTEIAAGTTIAGLLAEKKFRMNLVAVEYNGKIAKKSEFDEIVIQDGDVIEVVSFIGGG